MKRLDRRSARNCNLVTMDTTVLETDRLILRLIHERDLNDYLAFFSDEETMRFYPSTRSVDETREFINRQIRRYDTDGHGPWAVTLKPWKILIGYCGLIRQIVDSKTEVEIGYLIGRQYCRQGYASEAAIASRDYAFHQMGLSRLISLIDPQNIPSIGVARKVGMTLEKTSFWQGKWMNVYSITKKECR